MPTQEALPQDVKTEASVVQSPVALSTKSLPKRIVSFAKAAWKDNDLWVRSSSFGAGATFIAQGSIGIYLLLAAPLVTIATGAILCGAFIGIGAYGMYAGATSFKKSVKSLWDKHMEKSFTEVLLEIPPIGKFVRHPLVKKFNESRAGKAVQWAAKQALGIVAAVLPVVKAGLTTVAHGAKVFLGKAAKHPITQKIAATPPAQKFLNSRLGKLRHGLSQKHHDLFMSAMTLEGASFATIAGLAIVASQVTALPALTIGALLSATILVPAWWGLGASIDIYRSTSVLIRTLRHWNDDKKGNKPAVETKPAVEPIQQPSAIAQIPAGTVTPAFTEAASSAAPEKAPATPAPKPAPATPAPRP
jgi:hypothetical protein